jgi:hypothetical protein
MAHSENTYQPAPSNPLLLFASAAGVWGLIFLGVASVWPQSTIRTASPEREHVPQLVSLTEQRPETKSPVRARIALKRSKRERSTFAQRILRSSTSVN